MLLSIIIVSYNTKDLTLQTLKSTVADLNTSQLLKTESEIIVVDNNSADDSVKVIRDFKQKTKIPIKVISKKENLGFGKANNLGIEKSQGKYILLLNSDTIVRKNALATMIGRFENPQHQLLKFGESPNKLGILAATLLNTDLSIQPQGGSLPNFTSLFFHMSMMDDLPLIGKLLPSTQDTGKHSKQIKKYSANDTNSSLQNNKLGSGEPINIGWVGGTAMMIPKIALDEFGVLDPNIFMYGEDMEICLRAKNHHYQIAIDPNAQVIHLKNQSSSSENAIRGEFAGYLYIFSKHQNRTKTELAKIILQVGAILRIFIFSTIAKNKTKKIIYSKVLNDLNN